MCKKWYVVYRPIKELIFYSLKVSITIKMNYTHLQQLCIHISDTPPPPNQKKMMIHCRLSEMYKLTGVQASILNFLYTFPTVLCNA